MRTKQEETEELLETLCDSIKNIVHYYNGMLYQLTNNKYSVDTAREDYDSLIGSEDTDIVGILTEILTLNKQSV
jgi:hypothetical protein